MSAGRLVVTISKGLEVVDETDHGDDNSRGTSVALTGRPPKVVVVDSVPDVGRSITDSSSDDGDEPALVKRVMNVLEVEGRPVVTVLPGA